MRMVLICAVLIVMSVVPGPDAMGAKWSWEKSSEYCQILDNVTEPVYRMSLGYVPRSRFEGYGKSAFLELDADWNFAYLRDIALGDIDLSFRVRSILLVGSSGALQLPDQVAKIALDVDWTWRYANGMAVQIGADPGVYSDLEEFGRDVIFVPFSCSVIRSFSPGLSGIAGIEVRPGFARTFMPIVGVEWEISDMLRLEARLPESRFMCFINEDWSAYLAFDWQNTSFRLREKGSYDRGLMTVEDFRSYAGLTRRISDQLHLTCEWGRVFDRSIEFKRAVPGQGGPDSSVEIESEMFVRFALVGPF